jgi:hypothetical protein
MWLEKEVDLNSENKNVNENQVTKRSRKSHSLEVNLEDMNQFERGKC